LINDSNNDWLYSCKQRWQRAWWYGWIYSSYYLL